MAFKLGKEEMLRRDELVEKLNDLAGNVETAVAEYNSKIEELRAPVEAALTAYNEAAEDAREFAEGVSNDADEQIQEKSEKWQEGEKGEQACSWRDEWSALDFSAIEIEFPEEITVEGMDYGATLEQAPEEA